MKINKPLKQAGQAVRLHLSNLQVFLPVLILLVSGCGISGRTILKDSFNKNTLNSSVWEITESGDFSEKAVDIFDPGYPGSSNKVLRLKAGTRSTSSCTKTLGIRSLEKIDFSDGIVIEADLDWNSQKNGTYLSAVIMLSPDLISDLDKGKDFIAVEYTGVPPGGKAGVVIKRKIRRFLKVIYKDYGPADESGRYQGRSIQNSILHISIFLDSSRIKFCENEKEKYTLSPHLIDFSSVYFYLLLRSGTNYPPREIYFDNIKISRKTY